jgi:hypothetical protein
VIAAGAALDANSATAIAAALHVFLMIDLLRSW